MENVPRNIYTKSLQNDIFRRKKNEEAESLYFPAPRYWLVIIVGEGSKFICRVVTEL